MNYEAMPILRMEVEGMKAAIMTHLGVRGSELGQELSKAVDKAVAGFDWDGEVKRIVEASLRLKIESYFSYGGKGAKAVEAAVDEAFSAALGKAI